MALALPSNSKARLERVSKDKPSSLLGFDVSNEGKKFITLTPGDNVVKLFLFITDEETNKPERLSLEDFFYKRLSMAGLPSEV